MAVVGASTRFPAGLTTIDLPIGEVMIRIHHQDRGPIFFGPVPGTLPQNRFDAPNGEYRVLYAAARLEGAFVETVLRKPRRVLRRAYVDERIWTSLRVQRRLTLAKVYDEGLQFHGVDAGVIGAENYGASRELAFALFQELSNLDGLAYRSRYNNGEICYALFDRVTDAELTSFESERFDENPARVDALMRLYGASFDTSSPVPDPS